MEEEELNFLPTTPFENNGGISIDKEEPKLDEESLLALLEPASSSSSSSSSILVSSWSHENKHR